jgi:hypothetical protein
MSEELANFIFRHLILVSFVVKEDEAFDPMA